MKKGILKYAIFFYFFFAHLFFKIQKWVIALKPTTIAGVMITTTITTISGIQVYTKAKKIAEQRAKEEMANHREIASIEKKRPKYHKAEEKQFKIYNIALPIYVDSGKNKRPLKLDLVIETSNKYTRQYFDENYEYVHDHLNTKFLPTIPSFILEKEGKEVLKEKIKAELNILIKERGMKGEIKSIYFSHLLSS